MQHCRFTARLGSPRGTAFGNHWCNACLASGNIIIIFTSERSKIFTVKFLTHHMAYVKLYIPFFSSVLNSSIQNIQFPKSLTHYIFVAVVRTTAVKSRTHEQNTTSKTTHMVATAKITTCVFVTFSDCKESSATKPSRERM